MEANTTGIGAIIAVLHWLLPTLIGSALAVWYRRKDVVWGDKRTVEKLIISLVGFCAILIGVAMGGALGSGVIEILNISIYGFSFLIYILCGLSALKILDLFMKNIDVWLNIVISGITDMVEGVVGKLTGKFKSKNKDRDEGI